jgi:hypothetical protein
MGFGLPAQQAVEPGLVLVEAFEHPDVVGPELPCILGNFIV